MVRLPLPLSRLVYEMTTGGSGVGGCGRGGGGRGVGGGGAGGFGCGGEGDADGDRLVINDLGAVRVMVLVVLLVMDDDGGGHGGGGDLNRPGQSWAVLDCFLSEKPVLLTIQLSPWAPQTERGLHFQYQAI